MRDEQGHFIKGHPSCCGGEAWEEALRIDEATLRHLYDTQKLSQEEIARKFGVTQSYVSLLMQRFNIPRRSFGEWCKGKPSWNKGLKGYTNNGSFKKGLIPWNKGKKLSDEIRANFSKAKKELVAKGWKPWNLGFGDYIAGDKNPRWKGGTNGYRGPNWETQRQKALERDSYTCQDCGGTEDEISGKLEVHHIIPFEVYGIENYLEANRLENLITYCTSCHMKEEVVAWRIGS